MNFYTSDLHFGHKAMIKWDKRPFNDVEEMDAQMIARWNAKVSEKDNVYILGDFTYRSAHDPVWYLQQLKGKKHLIVGNHDKKMLKDQDAMKLFKSVERIMDIVDCGTRLHMCHFPMMVWEGKQFGHIHLHGHLHTHGYDLPDAENVMRNAYNVGCMFYDFAPATLAEIIDRGDGNGREIYT